MPPVHMSALRTPPSGKSITERRQHDHALFSDTSSRDFIHKLTSVYERWFGCILPAVARAQVITL